jgi:hypothetical protein
MLVTWQDKTWERMGECNHCGECCTGWRNPCPQLRILPDATSRCGMYERRGECNDPEVMETCGVHTTACVNFPASPGDLNYPAIRNKCSYYFVERPRVLVACPTHESKEYAWEEWAARVKALTYPAYDVLVAENSPTWCFMQRHGTEVPMIHVHGDPRPEMWLDRICRSMAAIQQRFLENDYAWWMNIEADVIPPAGVIETLMDYGRSGADWVSHCYPTRSGSEGLQHGIGCSLLSRRLMTDFDWRQASDSPDAELWQFVRSRPHTYRTVELWDVMEVAHRHA